MTFTIHLGDMLASVSGMGLFYWLEAVRVWGVTGRTRNQRPGVCVNLIWSECCGVADPPSWACHALCAKPITSGGWWWVWGVACVV